MRDIDFKKKISIFFGDNKIIGVTFLLIATLFAFKLFYNPMSYNPLLISLMGEENEAKVTNIATRTDGFYDVSIQYYEGKERKTSIAISKNNHEINSTKVINYINEEKVMLEGDQWDAKIVIAWALLILTTIIGIPTVIERLLIVKLFVYGQVTTAKLILKEKNGKNEFNLEYEYIKNNKEKERIEFVVNAKEDIEKVIKILYLEEDTDKFTVVTKEYDVDLYRI